MSQTHDDYWKQRIGYLETTIEELRGYRENTMKDDELAKAIDLLKEVLADIKRICGDCLINEDRSIELLEKGDDYICPVCNPDEFDEKMKIKLECGHEVDREDIEHHVMEVHFG